MRRYSSGVPFWGIRVPKIETTARTIKRGIVRRTEERESQREERDPFSFSVVDNGYLIKKLALSFGPTPARWTQFADESRFFMAFNALGIFVLAEGLSPVMADPAVLILPVTLLGHF